jgi:hypothetical protein
MVYVHLIPFRFGMNCLNRDLHMLHIEHMSKLQFSHVSEQIVVIMFMLLLRLGSAPVSHTRSIQKAE